MEEMPNYLWFIIYHSIGLVLPKKTPNHTHRTIGDMQASELACLNSNYISYPYRTTKRVCIIELQNACVLCSSITRAHYVEQKI